MNTLETAMQWRDAGISTNGMSRRSEMQQQTKRMNDELRVILLAYLEACEKELMPKLEEWIKKYPQYTQDLIKFAVYRHVVERTTLTNEEKEALTSTDARIEREALEEAFSALSDPSPLTSIVARAKEHSMEKGFKFGKVLCPECGEETAENWLLRHLKWEHPLYRFATELITGDKTMANTRDNDLHTPEDTPLTADEIAALEQNDKSFTRTELCIINERAKAMSKTPGMASSWRAAYTQLAYAADCLNAMNARSQVEGQS